MVVETINSEDTQVTYTVTVQDNVDATATFEQDGLTVQTSKPFTK